MRSTHTTPLATLALFALLATLTPGVAAQTGTPVPTLNLDRFTGTWYVIASLPEKRFKRCTHDSILLVALGDKPNSVQLLNACQTKRGYTEAANIDGTEKAGVFKLRTIWPFSRKLRVLALAPDYAWALLGSPNHKSLTVLSRAATLPPATLAELESQAAAQGFPTAKLVQQPQDAKFKAE